MKKRSVIHLILLAALVLLMGQLTLLALLLYPTKLNKHTSDVEIISNISLQLQLPLIIVDRPLLLKIVEYSKQPEEDCLLCTEDNIIVFAILYSSLQSINNLIRRIQYTGFHSVIFHNVQPAERPPNLGGDIPICIFLKHNIIIQLVILHDREANFWWHGSIHSDPGALSALAVLGFTDYNSNFMKFEGAYEKFVTDTFDVDGLTFSIPNNIPNFLRESSSSRFLECKYSAAQLFYQQFGKDKSHEARRFSHRAWKLLSKAKTILDALGVRFWLSSGTCLGYYRQCDIIPYSKDVDIGIFITDYNEKIVTEFLAHGFSLKHWFGKVNDSLEISFKSGNIKLDIFFFYEEEYWVWNGGTQAKSGKKFKYIFPRFTLCWSEFLELKVRVPCETLSYIEANYGVDWKVPVSQWDWKSSPPNVKENGMWPLEEWQHVIQVYE